MAGFTGAAFGNPADEALGLSNIASSPTEGLEWFAPEREAAALQQRDVALHGYADWKTGEVIAPEPRVKAGELQQRYGVAPALGVSGLQFNEDLPESVARAMHDAKLQEQRRADIAARAPGGFLDGAKRFGIGAAVQLLDPLGAASMLVPIGGEVRGVSMLARAGSAAVRGAATGAAVTAPFVALHKSYADAFGEDYSAGDALREILMGGALGGGLHAVSTVAGDLIGQRWRQSAAAAIVEEDPDIRHAAASEAVAAVLDDRAPNADAVIRLGAATKALEGFQAFQRGLDDDAAGTLARGGDSELAGVAAAETRLQAALDEHAGFLSDVSRTQAKLAELTDPARAERLTAIEEELAGTIPAARREALLAERDRTAQELAGLQQGAARAQRQLAEARAALEQAQAAAGGADRAFTVRAAAIEAREAMAQTLAERELRRAAGAMGVQAAPEDVTRLARAVLREGLAPADAIAGLRQAGGDVLPPAADPLATLRREARAAAETLHEAAGRANAVRPDDARAIREAAEAGARKPPELLPEDAELADLRAFANQAKEAGVLSSEDLAELRGSEAQAAADAGWLKAVPQAAACLLRGVL